MSAPGWSTQIFLKMWKVPHVTFSIFWLAMFCIIAWRLGEVAGLTSWRRRGRPPRQRWFLWGKRLGQREALLQLWSFCATGQRPAAFWEHARAIMMMPTITTLLTAEAVSRCVVRVLAQSTSWPTCRQALRTSWSEVAGSCVVRTQHTLNLLLAGWIPSFGPVVLTQDELEHQSDPCLKASRTSLTFWWEHRNTPVV